MPMDPSPFPSSLRSRGTMPGPRPTTARRRWGPPTSSATDIRRSNLPPSSASPRTDGCLPRSESSRWASRSSGGTGGERGPPPFPARRKDRPFQEPVPADLFRQLLQERGPNPLVAMESAELDDGKSRGWGHARRRLRLGHLGSHANRRG